MLNRRDFIKLSSLTSFSSLPFVRTTFAKAETEARYVVILLRGAMDGLAAVPAYGDQHYYSLRRTLALPSPNEENGILDLNGFFGLHPVMQNMHNMYQNKEALIFHSVASPYRQRSHFDAQRLLQNGTNLPLGADNGWLYRALQDFSGSHQDAIALAQKLPLILYGSQQVNSWSPGGVNVNSNDIFDRVARLYDDNVFFARQLNAALETQAMVEQMTEQGNQLSRRNVNRLTPTLTAAAQFLSNPSGPRLAVLESTGWDTHANQGSTHGRLANNLRDLDEGLGALKGGLNENWSNTVVTVVTEFGRTVAVNGTNGTDHGTASAAFMLGGAINGGQVKSEWPGLSKSNLHDGRDLAATLDVRSLFKSSLHHHLKISKRSLEESVFPDSSAAPILNDLIT